MKNLYEKPTVMVENFTLSENIASCDPSFSNNMADSIINDVKEFTGYFTGDYNCANMVDPNIDYMTPSGQKLCYHTSSAVIFSS